MEKTKLLSWTILTLGVVSFIGVLTALVWSFFDTTEYITLICTSVFAWLLFRIPQWSKENWRNPSIALLMLNSVLIRLQPQSTAAFDNNHYVALVCFFLILGSFIYTDILVGKVLKMPKRNKLAWSHVIVVIITAAYSLHHLSNIDYSPTRPLGLIVAFNYAACLLYCVHPFIRNTEEQM